jgi:hypothetical protein
MRIFFALLVIFSTNVLGLEIDEKLTVRILGTSESRKTVMINRGIEDGLAEGDHAKFIVTAGIVARGVAIKVSPTRSVWSIYRLVNADFIVNDGVMSIKISPPVKVTQDETKKLVQDDTPTKAEGESPKDLGIPLANGADDLGPGVDETEELSAMKSDEALIIPERNREIFAIVNISGLSAETSSETGSDSSSHSQSYHHIGLGGEIYSQNERQWYSSLSLFGALNLMRLNNQSYNGSSSTNNLTEFSFGSNWHFSKLPSLTSDFIPFLHFAIHLGSIKSSYTEGSENSSVDSLSSSGGTTGFSVGFGYKFFTQKGYGARVLLDYYSRVESYKEDEQLNKFSKSVRGPRFMVGLGYRF